MKRFLLIAIPTAALGSLIVWRYNGKKAEAAAQNQMRAMRSKAAPVVSVATATTGDIVEHYEGVGTAEAPFNVKISPKVTGRIDTVLVREGDIVHPGQVLVRLDPTEIQGQVQQARAAVAEAQSRLSQAMLTQGPTDTNIRTNIRQQEAAVDTAKSDLNLVLINSEAKKANQRTFITDAAGRVRNAEAAITNADAEVKAAQANLENARSKFDRVSGLYKQGFIAAQDVDDARTTVSVMVGALDVAQGQLNAAKANRDSMLAQKEAAEKQYTIGVNGVAADTASAKARLHQAEAALDYAKSNTAQKPAYEQNIAALKSAVLATQAGLASAQARLADTTLVSTVNGSVSARLMDQGATAVAGQPILTLVAAQQVWVTFGVPEEVYRNVTLGIPVQVEFDAVPGRKFVAKVFQQNPSADPASRQFQVRASIDNPAGILKPGMFARVKLTTSRTQNAIQVPREAVQTGDGSAYVLAVDSENVAHKTQVTLGPADVDYVSIAAGVQPGDKVIVLASVPIKDGMKVRIGGEKARGRANRKSGDQPATA